MKKGNVQIDLDTARKWYLSRDSFKQELALQAFTKEELEFKLPISWKEYSEGKIVKSPYSGFIYNNLDKLLILRDVYRQGWKPDWEDNDVIKYCIVSTNGGLEILINGIKELYSSEDIGYRYYSCLFSFPTEELAEQFLENFKDELKQLEGLS